MIMISFQFILSIALLLGCALAKTSVFEQQLSPDDEFTTEWNRIVGGELAPKDAYPWFAYFVVRNQQGGAYGQCGGMLVAPEYVLTAAHCGIPAGYQAEFWIGAVCPYEGGNCGQPLEIISAQRIPHPDYNDDTSDNDFALMKLSSRASATPVTMDKGPIVTNYSTSKRNLYAIGLGALYYQGPGPSELHHVELAYDPPDTCSSKYFITGHMVCASDPGQDSCQGDSGGPLYDATNNVLIGVTSFGFECASPGYPGVYAKVSSRWNWIQSTICKNHSNPKPDFCSPCGAGEIDFSLNLNTDTYPEETSWTLESSDGSTKSGGTFSDKRTTYNSQYCLDESLCHTFTMNDSYGDGLGTEGSFSVLVDNDFVLSNSGTFSSLNVEFGQCNDDTVTTPAPSDSPTINPTPAPTSSPTIKITPAPTTSPPVSSTTPAPSDSNSSSSNCVDSPLRFKINKNGKKISRGCDWVANKSTNSRCKLAGVTSMCPDTCGECGTCIDGLNRFTIIWKNRKVTRDCVWVGTKQINQRCGVRGVSETCKETCGSC